MTQNDSEDYIMFSNPQEGPECPATSALLMFVIPAQTDQCLGGVLGVWPSYQTRDNMAAVLTHHYPKIKKTNIWWAPTMYLAL